MSRPVAHIALLRNRRSPITRIVFAKTNDAVRLEAADSLRANALTPFLARPYLQVLLRSNDFFRRKLGATERPMVTLLRLPKQATAVDETNLHGISLSGA